MTKKCPKCGATVMENSKICVKCGASVENFAPSSARTDSGRSVNSHIATVSAAVSAGENVVSNMNIGAALGLLNINTVLIIVGASRARRPAVSEPPAQA